MSVVTDQAQAQRFTLRVPPAFFDELWCSIVDCYEERDDQRAMGLIVEGLKAAEEGLPPGRRSRKDRTLAFDSMLAAEWFHGWLLDEAAPHGRWADWGLEGAHLRRTARRLRDELAAQVEREHRLIRERQAAEDARVAAEGEFETAPALVIERAADPLPGGRAQLVQTVFVDGQQIPELSHPVGSPASADTVKQYVETISYDVSGRRI